MRYKTARGPLAAIGAKGRGGCIYCTKGGGRYGARRKTIEAGTAYEDRCSSHPTLSIPHPAPHLRHREGRKINERAVARRLFFGFVPSPPSRGRTNFCVTEKGRFFAPSKRRGRTNFEQKSSFFTSQAYNRTSRRENGDSKRATSSRPFRLCQNLKLSSY